jgi:hypothetical protein
VNEATAEFVHRKRYSFQRGKGVIPQRVPPFLVYMGHRGTGGTVLKADSKASPWNPAAIFLRRPSGLHRNPVGAGFVKRLAEFKWLLYITLIGEKRFRGREPIRIWIEN